MPHLISSSVFALVFLAATCVAQNRIVNGDFEAGNIDFGSDYVYQPGTDLGAASYEVGIDPSLWNTAFAPCGDHSSGGGFMMMVNGATNGSRVWEQTIAVSALESFEFSFWATSLFNFSAANLEIRIDGVAVTSQVISSTPCSWQRIAVAVPASTMGQVTLAIHDINLDENGNDFAIDDIALISDDDFPGSNDDLRLMTGVNASADEIPIQALANGDFATFFVDSPGGTYNFETILVVAQMFPTGGMTPPSPPGFPEIYIDPSGNWPFRVGVLFDGNNQPLGQGVLPPNGLSFAIQIPRVPIGVTVMVQAIALAPSAQTGNGFLTASPGHRFPIF